MGAESDTTTSLGQRPWLTWALLTAFVVGLTLAQHRVAGIEAETDAALGAAIDYYDEHPFLEPPKLLASRVGESTVAANRKRYERDRQRRGMPPIPAGVMARYQDSLDERVLAGLAPLDRLPQLRFGVRATARDALTLVSHPLVHTSWLHLLGSGLLLLILGTFIERTWGHTLFAVTVLATSVSAGLAFRLGSPGFGDPLVGSCGLLAGLLGAYAVRYASTWKDPIYASLLLFGLAWLVLPAWFGWDPSIARGAGSAAHLAGTVSPSWWAVAGGFGAGALLAGLLTLTGLERAWTGSSADAQRTGVANPMLDKALRAHAEGQTDRAHALLVKLLEAEPDNREGLIAMWDVACDLGRPADAAAAMLDVVRAEARSGDVDEAVAHWAELTERGLEGDAEPALLIRIALILREQGQLVASVNALRTALRVADDSSRAVVAERVARETRELDPQTAQAAAWRALGSVELDLAQRQSLEAMLGELIAEDREARAIGARPAAAPEPAVAAPPRAEAEPERSDSWVDPELGEESSGDGVAEAPRPAPIARPAPIDLDVSMRRLQVVLAQPTELADAGVVIEAEGGVKKRIPYDRVDAIAVAAVEGIGSRPVIVIDLALDWHASTDGTLRVIRLRSDRFDPRRFGSEGQSALDAIRGLIDALLAKTGATPLPDPNATRGFPFAAFSDIQAYHRDILGVELARDLYSFSDED